ncbi:MAG: cutinase family protein [Solirubrobacteraceae bacterium]|nr:cutinase family protein [Solirubrobacteraceae bacterium]
MASVPGRRIFAGVVSTLAVALIGAMAQPAAAAETPYVNPSFNDRIYTSSDVTCSAIIVYASRGAGENLGTVSKRAVGQFEADGVTPRSKYYDGLGEELLPIYSNFRDLYAPGAISLVTNRAPQTTDTLGGTDPQGPTGPGHRGVGVTFTRSAFYDYALGVNDGKRAAISDLDTIHARCPDSKLVVMGYSAGAEINRRAMASLSWKPKPGTAMAISFGDPTWRPKEPYLSYVGDADFLQFGSIQAARHGDFGFKISIFGFSISSIPDYPDGWNATSYCHGGDMSCQYRGGLITAHETYHLEDAVGAAFKVAGYIGGPFVKPVIVANINSKAVCFKRGSRVNTTFKVLNAGPDDTFTIKSSWEPLPFQPFADFTLSAERPVARRSSYSGLFPRFRMDWNGNKLDYRNVC